MAYSIGGTLYKLKTMSQEETANLLNTGCTHDCLSLSSLISLVHISWNQQPAAQCLNKFKFIKDMEVYTRLTKREEKRKVCKRNVVERLMGRRHSLYNQNKDKKQMRQYTYTWKCKMERKWHQCNLKVITAHFAVQKPPFWHFCKTTANLPSNTEELHSNLFKMTYKFDIFLSMGSQY